MWSKNALFTLGILPVLSYGQRNYRGNGNGGGPFGSFTGTVPPTATGAVGDFPPFSTNATGLTGDSQCVSLMCISAIVYGSTVEYVLQATGSQTPGWMAMGFGSQMSNSPMVIMWSNSDGSVTLSQRQASGHVQPSVVASPPRVATAVPSLTSLSGSTPKFGYSIPANSDTQQAIVWAFGTVNPSSSAVDAQLVQHTSAGSLSLDLTNALSNSPTNPATSSNAAALLPLLPYQKVLLAHAVLCGVAFLIMIPLGSLTARWLRTYRPEWFNVHRLFQLFLAGPLAVAGVALGISGSGYGGGPHLADTHQRLGVAIFVLYLAQVVLGLVIHHFKRSPRRHWYTGMPTERARPPQNYMHVVLGLLIVMLAFYQVRLGYTVEWPNATGRGPAPKGVNSAWIAWVVIFPVAYIAGLILLPKQFRQERQYRSAINPTALANTGPDVSYGNIAPAFAESGPGAVSVLHRSGGGAGRNSYYQANEDDAFPSSTLPGTRPRSPPADEFYNMYPSATEARIRPRSPSVPRSVSPPSSPVTMTSSVRRKPVPSESGSSSIGHTGHTTVDSMSLASGETNRAGIGAAVRYGMGNQRLDTFGDA